MNDGFHILIPARLASTRLPDKPLADLGGRSLIVRVLERAHAAGAASVHVATDSERVARCVQQAGGAVVMTRADHASGTDRLVEAVQRLGLAADQIVVNLQGDEPLMPLVAIRSVVDLLEADGEARMATLWRPLESASQWRDPNVVKLVTDAAGRALYFSRAPVPWPRGREFQPGDGCRHVGLYAYRVSALRAWPDLPPSRLEVLESLEQLRALSAGWGIACAPCPEPVPAGIDTPEDLARVRANFFHAGQKP